MSAIELRRKATGPSKAEPSPANPDAKRAERRILTINRGSSSVKFALYEAENPSQRLLWGKIERIGLPGTKLIVRDSTGKSTSQDLEAADHRTAGTSVIRWLEKQFPFSCLAAVGHRVVHGGMKHTQPERVTPELVEELRHISPYDPEHMPAEIQLIEAFQQHHPELLQVACFDTAFHHGMPRVAKILPIPRRFDAKGIQRYGFHGISYAFLMEQLAQVGGEQAALGRVILAHLGNGASLAAVKNGHSIDTSMAFTPTAGFPMSTRSGDLDPGLVWYLAEQEHISPKQFHDMVNQESGLLGVSETSPDMRDLLAREGQDVRAAETIAMFCYHVKKWIGAFATALGGLDTLVFSAGIGENIPIIRERICEGLEFLGIHIDNEQNASNAPVISTGNSPVTVRVMRTDEEIMIAKTVARWI